MVCFVKKVAETDVGIYSVKSPPVRVLLSSFLVEPPLRPGHAKNMTGNDILT